MICDECKTPEECKWHCVCVAAPLECLPCAYCNSSDEVYCEIPVMGDHNGRGFVMRIGCLCEQCCKDEFGRTMFEKYDDAIGEWNYQQEKKA